MEPKFKVGDVIKTITDQPIIQAKIITVSDGYYDLEVLKEETWADEDLAWLRQSEIESNYDLDYLAEQQFNTDLDKIINE